MDCTHYGFFAAHGNLQRQTERNVDARARGRRLTTLVVLTIALTSVDSLAGDAIGRIEGFFDVCAARGLTGVRLSCQIPCDHDMTVRAISRLEGSGRADAGSRPADDITPPPEWTTK